jgi:hypothetical protein
MKTIQRTTLVGLFAITTALLVAPSFACASNGESSPRSPYAEQQARQTKALSEAETAASSRPSRSDATPSCAATVQVTPSRTMSMCTSAIRFK